MSPKAKEILNWFIKAKRDLTVAGMNLANDPPITDDALFHCQQAVEKSLKGFLVFHDKPFKKTHVIGEIAKDVLIFEPSLEPLLRRATEFTPYATMFRYPGELDIPPVEDAQDALILAQQIYDQVLAKIPEESRPA